MVTFALACRPAAFPAWLPTRMTRMRAFVPVAAVLSVAPAWVEPSMTRGAEMTGNGEVGLMDFQLLTPFSMANRTRSRSGVAFASMMAARSVHRRAALRPPAVAHTPSPGSLSGLSPRDLTTNVSLAAATGTAVTTPAPPTRAPRSERDATSGERGLMRMRTSCS